MMTTTMLIHTIFFSLLMVCKNVCILGSECPLVHKYNSSEIEVMRNRFESWLKQHDRSYKDKEEWEDRFGIYQANLQYIECKNSQKNSYNLSDNKFADLTNEEFRSIYTGFGARLLSHIGFRYHEHGVLPACMDWRKEGAVTDIKDQGHCGNVSCNI